MRTAKIQTPLRFTRHAVFRCPACGTDRRLALPVTRGQVPTVAHFCTMDEVTIGDPSPVAAVVMRQLPAGTPNNAP